MGNFMEQDITYTKEDIHRLIGIFGENIVHKMRKANLEAEIHEITKELNYYKERIDRAEVKSKEIEKSLKEHNSLSAQMNDQIAHLTKEKQYLEHEIEKFSNIEQKAAELIDRDARIFSLKKDVGILEGKAGHIKETHDKVTAEKTRVENILSETQKKFDALSEETTKLRESLAFQKSVIPPYKDTKELQKYKDEAQRAIEDIKKSVTSAGKEITKSTETLSARTALCDKLAEEQKSLTATKEKLEKEIAEVTGYESVEELQRAVAELQSDKDSLSATVTALENTKAEKEGQKKKTEHQIDVESRYASDYEKTVSDHNAKREEVRVLKEDISLRELEVGVTERLTEFSVPIEEFLKLNHKALKSIADKYEASLTNVKSIFGGLL